MEFKKTYRGFDYIEFEDLYGHVCSMQKSSLADEDAIWFGPDDAEPKRIIFGQGWQPVEFPEGTDFYTRMHLSREQVRELLPILRRFARTGEIKQS